MSTDANANPGRIRASDAEREEFARIVREATADGRLSLAEGDERLAEVYATKFRDELRPLVADLPVATQVEPARRNGRPDVEPEYPRVHPALFARHAGAVLVVSMILVGLWALAGGGFFWPAIPLVFFGLSIVRHARWAGRRRYPYRSYPGRWSAGSGRWPST